MNQISLIAGSTQNIQKPETSETKNPFVTTICAIKTIPFAMVHAGGSQMTDPPHRQKERQQQTVYPRFFLNQTGLQVPSSTFAILKG